VLLQILAADLIRSNSGGAMTPSTVGPKFADTNELAQIYDVRSSVVGTACNDDQILVQQTSTKSWVVRHLPVPDHSGGLIGCVEERDGTYEVMRINDGFRWQTHTTLDDAIKDLSQLAQTRSPAPPTDLFSHLR
jgi:hypothetical protein